MCAYGGSAIKDQIADLKRGAEIVVCTPGRMIDLLMANQGRVTNLKRVTYMVMDEADRMFDMGFEPQVMKIVNNTRPDRQTVLFSATFPRQMEALARRVLENPLEILVGGRSVVSDTVTQFVEVVEEDAKFFKLLEVMGRYYDPDKRILIFVDTQVAFLSPVFPFFKNNPATTFFSLCFPRMPRTTSFEMLWVRVTPACLSTEERTRWTVTKSLRTSRREIALFSSPPRLPPEASM